MIQRRNNALVRAYGPGKFGLSFELFPPKTEAGDKSLYEHVERLVGFRPSYITCTYGAGGSTRDKTLEIVQQVKERFRLPVASHLTCVGSTADQLRRFLTEASERGIDSIVALRGDPPRGETAFKAVEGGFCYANELVSLINSEFPHFGVAVAGYPEKHQEAPDERTDLECLHRKVHSGADVVITQLFYDNSDFFRFRERYEEIGIAAPLVPGILPVTNLAQIQRITSLCGARLPASFIDRLSKRDDADWQFQVGVEFAARQVQELVDRGIPGLHFYVLNKSQATAAVLEGVRMPSRK
ncbi:MAG: methylenetetrahydrofolate reductase [NAD(P)H] [Planctomycetes bacterium]|nr:methylenetetrahydrofolate reductase [NAD(P)H] [Planctomycetota bacterium]